MVEPWCHSLSLPLVHVDLTVVHHESSILMFHVSFVSTMCGVIFEHVYLQETEWGPGSRLQ